MNKWTLLLTTAALLAACGDTEEGTNVDPHAQHIHEGHYYDNEQLTLKDNKGEQALSFPPILEPTSMDGNSVTYDLTAQQGKMTFIDDIETNTYGYNGNFLGPVIRLKQGQDVQINVKNELTEPTTFHWHGLEVAGDATDGGPHAVIEPGVTEQVQFTVEQQPATLWYHPHPMGYTAKQVYNGLAGLLYIDDENVDLPNDYAVNDFPLILQDRTFVDGKIVYEEVANTMSTLGDTVMINGVVNPYLTASREVVRLRVLNGSNSMQYDLKFDNDLPFQLIATDGGFVNKPETMQSLSLGAGERAEILVDLSKVEGDSLTLWNNEMELLPIRLSGERKVVQYADSLNEIEMTDELLNAEPSKVVTMEGMTKNFLLNGQTFDPERIDFKQEQGVTEVWEIGNVMSDEGAMAHPFHIHGTQFLVLSVNGETPDESLQGYKDTVTVYPMQKVRIAVRFPEKGVYMFHCHILEHEDVGMMGQIEVY